MKLYHQAHRRYFAGAVISVLIATILGVTLQFFKGLVLDYAIAGNIPATLRFAGLLFSFIIAEIGFYYVYDHFSIRYVAGSSHNLRNDLFQSILKRDYIRYQQLKLGEYLAKFTNDASAIESRRFELLPLLWQILFKILAVSIGLFILDWRVALVTLGLLTTPLYLPKLIEKQLQQAQTNYLNSLESSLSEITDWLKGFELIKNYTIEQELMKQYRPINHHVAKRQLINRRVEILAQLITTLISYLSYFVILAVSTWLVLTKQFSAGDFFIAIGMIDQLSYPLISLSGIIRQLISIRPTTEAMQTFIHQPEVTRAKHSLKRWDDQIIFQSVNFSYEDRLILNDLDLRFTKGKRYLIKGPSGSGKTTIINLLLRYFEPDDGQILVDQTPLEQYDDVYPVMTIVRQDATFFVASLRDNLTMFQEVAEDRIKEILQAVGLGRYADSSLLDVIVQEGGSNFSGGERKRLSLVRALLRDTDVLLIDEPLANLDDFTARLIEDLLLSIKHKTMIIVSHQFSPEKLNQLDQVIELT